MAEHLPIRPDENLRQQVLDRLNSQSYDCIVIGAGVRMTEKHVPEFEVVVNAVRQGAPATPLAFNSSQIAAVKRPRDGLPSRMHLLEGEQTYLTRLTVLGATLAPRGRNYSQRD